MNSNDEHRERDLYNDKILDVSSLEDLKEDEGTVNLLSKQGKTLLFEYADDFWKIEDGILYQYPDYVSMVNNEQGKAVYNSNNLQDTNNTIYGKVIKEAIDNEPSFETISDLSLKERKNYIKKGSKVDGAVRLPITIDKEKLQQNTRKIEDITNKAFESIDKQDTKPMLDLVKLCIKTIALFLMFFKRNTIAHQKHKIIDKIIKGLDDNTLDINKLLADKEINQKIPELKEILERYQKQYVSLDIKSQKEAVKEILKDNRITDVAEKLSEDKIFIEQLADKFSIEVTKRLDVTLPQGYEQKIINTYSQSGISNPTDFSKEFLMKNLEELYKENKNITPQEYTLSVAFISQMINPDENKNLLAETMAQTLIDSKTSSDEKTLSVVENIVHKCIKNELDLTKTQQQQR